MSRFVLNESGLVIAEHDTTVELPITYVLHHPATNGTGFKISIYQERWLGVNNQTRVGNSDIPFCTWTPERGRLTGISNLFTWYRDAGLVPEMEETCQQMYAAWKKGEGLDD